MLDEPSTGSLGNQLPTTTEDSALPDPLNDGICFVCEKV